MAGRCITRRCLTFSWPFAAAARSAPRTGHPVPAWRRRLLLLRSRSMDWQDAALGAAGFIGSVVAVVHGILVHRIMVRPLEAISVGEARLSGPVRRLVPPLLHFS